LSAQVPAARIIALLGGGRVGMLPPLARAAVLGASRTLRKPLTPLRLLTLVRELLPHHLEE
jgi:hypothetical protein